jgi:glycosyltransferase 2 family protein
LLGAVVSVLAIYFIVSQMDIARLGQALATARYIYVLPCLALLVVGLYTRAIRWRILLSESLPVQRAFSIMNVSYLVNGLLPLRIGEVARAYLATRAQPPVPVFKSLSTIIVERLLDLLAVLALMALAITAGPLPDELRAAGTVALPGAIGGFLLLVFLARQQELTHKIVLWVGGRTRISASLQGRIIEWLDHFLDGLAPLTKIQTLLLALGWTAISWGLSVAAGYILMFAFYDRADWAATCLFIAAASFAIALPAVPGNVGTYEGAIILALVAMGMGEPPETALAFAVVVHGANLMVYALTGVMGFIQEGISLEQLSQGVQGIRQHTS